MIDIMDNKQKKVLLYALENLIELLESPTSADRDADPDAADDMIQTAKLLIGSIRSDSDDADSLIRIRLAVGALRAGAVDNDAAAGLLSKLSSQKLADALVDVVSRSDEARALFCDAEGYVDGEPPGWFDVDTYSTKARWEGPDANDGGLDGFLTLEAAIEYANSPALAGNYEVVVSAWGEHERFEAGERVWTRFNRPLAGDMERPGSILLWPTASNEVSAFHLRDLARGVGLSEAEFLDACSDDDDFLADATRNADPFDREIANDGGEDETAFHNLELRYPQAVRTFVVKSVEQEGQRG